MLIYLNGKWVPAEDASIPFFDQGFQYGDSLFETVRVVAGEAFRLDKHLDRLRSGMETIHLDGEHLVASISKILEKYILKNEVENALLRIMMTRGMTRDTPWQSESEPALYVSHRSMPQLPETPAKVVFMPESDYPLLRFHPAIKSGNYLGNMLAKKEAASQGAFEPVFVNRQGYVTECAIRNIFFIKEDSLLTPALELGVLPGVMRDTVLELAANRGIWVKETLILEQDVKDMDEAFISSTGIGILPVTWEGFSSDYAHTQRLMVDLNHLLLGEKQNVT